MTIQLGETAPDFTAETTEGRLNFYEYLGDHWGVLFSHPADFTPVCTTELGAFANRKDEFTSRNTRIIGVSVDSVESHKNWSVDIAETQGRGLNYPLVGDEDRTVANLYGMIHPKARDGHGPHGVHHRSRQEGEADSHLPCLGGSQHRRDPAGP